MMLKAILFVSLYGGSTFGFVLQSPLPSTNRVSLTLQRVATLNVTDDTATGDYFQQAYDDIQIKPRNIEKRSLLRQMPSVIRIEKVVQSKLEVPHISSTTDLLPQVKRSVTLPKTEVQLAKAALIEKLEQGQDENSETLKPLLRILVDKYKRFGIDARYWQEPSYNGDWSNVNVPAFPSRLGLDENGLPLYKIGSLTFGLLKAGKDVVCRVEQMVQRVHPAKALPNRELVPDKMKEAFDRDPRSLRTNHIDTIFIVPATDDIPEIRGTLRMEGYTIPSANTPNQYDTWFVRGHCFPDPITKGAFEARFGSDKSQLSYDLPKAPTAFQSVVYLDEDFRVSIGHHGTVMILRK